MAFLFNWIGFLLLMCFCHTIASRYGALSGFGLSLTKWTLIVKHSTDLASRENSWLWWLIMAFGNYSKIKCIFEFLSNISYSKNVEFNLLILMSIIVWIYKKQHCVLTRIFIKISMQVNIIMLIKRIVHIFNIAYINTYLIYLCSQVNAFKNKCEVRLYV